MYNSLIKSNKSFPLLVGYNGSALIGFRQERGIEGELLVSLNFDKLGYTHEHHDFFSNSTYCRTQGTGVDIWNHDDKLYIEVKHFPNSYLSGTKGFYKHIGNRFRYVPIDGIKLVIQIGGYNNKSFRSKCRSEGIYFIYVGNSTQLKTKLRLFLQRLGLLDNGNNGGRDQPAYKGSTGNTVDYTVDNGISNITVNPINNELDPVINDRPPPIIPISTECPVSDNCLPFMDSIRTRWRCSYG